MVAYQFADRRIFRLHQARLDSRGFLSVVNGFVCAAKTRLQILNSAKYFLQQKILRLSRPCFFRQGDFFVGVVKMFNQLFVAGADVFLMHTFSTFILSPLVQFHMEHRC